MPATGTGSMTHLCGRFEVEIEGRDAVDCLRGPQARLVLAYLIDARNRPVSRGELITLLWPERHPRDPHGTLRPILSGVRRALGTGALSGKDQLSLGLPEPAWVDTEKAVAAVSAARAAAASQDWGSTRELAHEARDLLRRGFLPGVESDWAASRRRELEEVELEALEWTARSGLALGGPSLAAAVEAARELIARSAFRESGHQLLMEGLAAAGNVAEALRVYEELRCLLRDELGTAPSRELQLLHQRLLGADTSGGRPPARLAVPAALERAGARGEFVGRDAELHRLREVWRAVLAGGPRVALLSGDPGIGKTRLAAQFAHVAHADGANVLYGRCDEEALGGYQPFVEAIGAWASNSDFEELRARAGPAAAVLASLVPELDRRLPGLRAPVRAAPEQERYRLLDAVRELLLAIAEPDPVLLVLDDLHWADPPTLLMLRHISRMATGARMLVVGTYRETELDRTHPLVGTLDDLRREHVGEQLDLRGLDEQDTVALIGSRMRDQIPIEVVRAIHDETDGNPFFIEELLHQLGERVTLSPAAPGGTISRLGVPEGVKPVISRRIARLPDEAARLLQIASVAGRDFDLEVLEHAAPAPGVDLAEVLERPVSQRLIEELPGAPGKFRFVHALIRESLYEQLTATRRARLHARVGEAIEQLHQLDIEEQLPALAHHFYQAAAAGPVDKAIAYTRRAAQHALVMLAYEEAVTQLTRALELLSGTNRGDELLRCELLAELGDAQMKSGLVEEGRQTFERVAELARRLDAPELLAGAALGFGAHWLLYLIRGEIDHALIALLEDTLARLPPEATPLRARIEARLAWELYYTYQPARMAALIEDAVAIGRRTGDIATLAQAMCTKPLTMMFEGYGLERPKDRLHAASEALALSERSGDVELILWSRSRRLVALLDLGDFAGVDREIEAFRELVQTTRIRAYNWYVLLWDALRAIMRGDFAAAEALAGQALAAGQDSLGQGAVEHYGMQILTMRFYAGQLEGQADALTALAAQFPTPQPAVNASLARLHALEGRRAEAQREIDWLSQNDFAPCPRDVNWLATASFTAWACMLVGDSHAAATLYRQLLPYADQCVRVSGTAATCYGSLWRALAQLATTTEDWALADRHFQAAIVQNTAIGHRPELAQTQLDYATMLTRRGNPDDGARATELLNSSLTTAHELGMTFLQRAGTELAGLMSPRG